MRDRGIEPLIIHERDKRSITPIQIDVLLYYPDSKFLAEECETGMTEETMMQLAGELKEIVRSLQYAIGDNDLIEELPCNRLESV